MFMHLFPLVFLTLFIGYSALRKVIECDITMYIIIHSKCTTAVIAQINVLAQMHHHKDIHVSVMISLVIRIIIATVLVIIKRDIY